MCFGNLSPIATRISSSLLPSRPLAAAKPFKSGAVSMSQTMMLAPMPPAGGRAPASMDMTVGGAKDDVLHTLFVEHVGEGVSSRLRQAGHAGEIDMAHLPRELFVAQ